MVANRLLKRSKLAPKLLLACSILALTLVASGQSRAATFTLTPDAFGAVRSFASQTFSNSPVQLFDQALIGLEDQGILEFDVSGVTGNLVSAELYLPLQRGSLNFSGDVQVALFSGDGSVSFADDFGAGTVAQTFSYDGSLGSQQFITLDITSAVSSLLTGGATFIGVNGRFDLPTTPHNATLQFGFNVVSPGFETWPELRLETLDVAAVPVPTALPLFMAALGLMAFLGRRRKRVGTA